MKRNPNLPDGAGTHDQRKAIAQMLTRKIDAYREHVCGMRDRWDVNEAFYRNQPESMAGLIGHAVTDEDGTVYGDTANRIRDVAAWQATEHHPVVQPIIDAAIAQQYNAIVINSEYCTGETFGQSKELVGHVQKTIQNFYHAGSFDQALDDLLLISSLCGVAFLRQTMAVDVDGLLSTRSNPDVVRVGPVRYAGLNFDVIHPRDIAVYPLNSPNIEACSVVAHRVQMMRRAEIEELQEAGRYLGPDEVGGLTETDTVDQDESTMSADFSRGMDSTSNAVEEGDHQVEIWTGLAKLKLDKGAKFERWYEFVIAKDSEELLQIKEYAYPRPWYFPFYAKKEPGRLIPRSSPAQDLQALQRSANELWNQYLDAAFVSTLPSYVADRNSFNDSIIALTPGKVTLVENLSKDTFIQFPVGANQTAARDGLQYITQLAQLVARVSSNTMGNAVPAGTTATEASIIQAGNATNSNYALKIFSQGLTEAWGFAQVLIADDFAFLKSHYGDAIPVLDDYGDFSGEDAMRWPIRWSVTGKEINTNPAYAMQTLIQLLGVGLQMEQSGNPVLDSVALVEAAANSSGLTDAYNIILTPEQREIKRAEMQQMALMQAIGGMAGDGGDSSGAG